MTPIYTIDHSSHGCPHVLNVYSDRVELIKVDPSVKKGTGRGIGSLLKLGAELLTNTSQPHMQFSASYDDIKHVYIKEATGRLATGFIQFCTSGTEKQASFMNIAFMPNVYNFKIDDNDSIKKIYDYVSNRICP